jgi:hypothetical protein
VLRDAFKDGCLAYTSVWMHSRSSTSESSKLQDYVAPRPLEARTCAAAGTKFFDRDADGARDPGEPGLERFVIFADYDGDGERDAGEPFTVTDDDGHYVLDDIRPPGGSYTLREQLPDGGVAAELALLVPGSARTWAARLRVGSDQRRPGALRARPRLRELVSGPIDGAQGALPLRRSRPVRPADRRGGRPARGR